MKQEERRAFLIETLLAEQPEYRRMEIPTEKREQEQLLRALVNVRRPREIRRDFLDVQDAYLQERAREKGIVDLSECKPIQGNLYLWKGDITRLAVDAIVNAANSGMTGCYCPCHGCIDNCIHTFAGVQLRRFCAEIMKKQGQEEPTGQAKCTPAFNLPCQYVLHTVGPIVQGELTPADEVLLADCYRSCLELAEKKDLSSVAFCCISTGEFHFPNQRAAEIALQTVQSYLKHSKQEIKVIFNVFKEEDKRIYEQLLRSA